MDFVQFLCSRFCSLLDSSGNQQSLKYEAPLWSMLRHEIFLDFSCPVLMLSRPSQAAIPIYSAWLADVQSTQSNQDWEWMSKSVWMQHSATRNPKTKEHINYRRNQAHASSPLQDAQKKGRAQQFESQNRIHGTWISRDFTYFTVRNAAFQISTHLKSTCLWSAAFQGSMRWSSSVPHSCSLTKSKYTASSQQQQRFVAKGCGDSFGFVELNVRCLLSQVRSVRHEIFNCRGREVLSLKMTLKS